MLKKQVNHAGFIEGGGEAGELIRSIDWSKTSIGAAVSWPQSLKTSITTALNTRFPILIWWGQELILIYNDAYIPIFAGKHPQAMGKPGLSQYGWGEDEVRRVIEPMLRGVMETGKPTWSEDQLLILERNGYPEECYFTWSYSPILLENGKVGGVLTIVTETTQRVISQRRLNILRDLGEKTLEAKTLKEAYNNVVEVLDAHPLDLPFFLLYLREENENMLMLSGMSTRLVRNSYSPQSLSLHENESGTWPVSGVVRSVKEEVIHNLSGFIGEIPSGVWRELVDMAFITPIVGAGQKTPYGVLITGISPRLEFDDAYKSFLRLLTDQIATAISNVRTIEEERKRAEALAEIDKAKTTFFSNISHEFRTPLTLMLGPLQEVLENAAALNDHDRANLKTSYRNSLRLQKLVNTLLDFSRIGAGRFKVSPVETDVARLTADLASSFRSAIEQAGISYVVVLELQNPCVLIDADIWEKIVLNLVSNAFKYTREGTIEVSLKQTDGYLLLKVRDTGVGISREHQSRVFERFYRVENLQGRSQEGTGIGLSMVRELVHLLGGRIDLESEPGIGSTFTVEVPVEQRSLQEQPQVLPEANGQTTLREAFVDEVTSWDEGRLSAGRGLGENGSRGKVLVADDNSDMRDYIQRLLQDDFDVYMASNGEDAFTIAQEVRPDLILSDIMMPKLDGFGLLKKLKSGLATRFIPVVFLSARAGEEARVEGLEAGADDYLVKPFSARELVARVANHVAIGKTRGRTESAFFNLFLQSPAHIHIFRGPEHIVEFFHPLGILIVGKDLTGMKIREALPEVEGQGYFEMLDEVYHKGKTFSLTETRAMVRGENGELNEHFFNITYLPWKDADGKIQGVFQFTIDVTEQARTNQKIRESEERFRILTETIPQIVWIAGPDGRIEYLSRQWEHYTAVSISDGLLQFSSFIHEEDIASVRAAWHNSLAKKASWRHEFRLRNISSGEYRWFSGQTTPILDDNGDIVKWIGSASDIHQQKQLNEELEKLVTERTMELLELTKVLKLKNDELAKAQNFLQTVLDSSIELVTAFDTNLNYTFVNKRLKDLADRNPEDLIGRNVLDVEPGFEKTDGYEYLMRALNGETVHIAARRPNIDKSLVFETYVIPLKREGKVMGVVTMQRDITAIVRLTEKLKLSNEELKRSNEDLQQFAHVTSHDLKEPVRKIRMYGGILKTDFSEYLPEKGRDYVEKIEKAANRISSMIDGVLQYSSIEAAGEPTEHVDLNATMKTIIDDLEIAISDTRARVEVSRLPVVKGSPVLIYQLFYNLINNSLKFRNPKADPHIKVTALEASHGDDDFVLITVDDNGIGFDQAYADKIFESFSRLNSKDKYEGTGLGLALCKKIVMRHNGRITAEGTPGVGAKFNVYLPRTGW